MADDREGRGRPLKPPPGKRGARLSQEERALWEHTAASLQPIKGKKGRVHAALEDSDGEPIPSKRETAKPAPPKKPAVVAPSPPPAAKITLPPPAPAPIALERRKARKLSSGRIEIDGRIDLHGMRQSEAHVALRRFLKRGYAEGKRWVLVITGKGAPARTALDERDRARRHRAWGPAAQRAALAGRARARRHRHRLHDGGGQSRRRRRALCAPAPQGSERLRRRRSRLPQTWGRNHSADNAFPRTALQNG